MSSTTGSRRLVSASILILSLTLLSRMLGIFREMLTASRFGASATMDAFNSAFRVPDLLYNSLFTFLIGTALVPVFSSVWESGNREDAWRLASSVLTWIVVVLGTFCGFLYALAPWILRYIAPGLSEEDQHLAVTLARTMLPLILAGGLTGFYKSLLTTLGYFGATGLIPVAFNVCVLITVFAFSSVLGVHALAVGTAIGAVAQTLILLPSSRALGFRWRFSLELSEPVRRVGRLLFPTMAALAVGQVMGLVENILASHLAHGAIASLGFAYRIFTVPDQIYTTVVSAVFFPSLARMLADHKETEVRSASRRILQLTLFIVVPLSLLMAQLSPVIVRVLLRHGSFDEAAVRTTAAILAPYALGLPAVCVRSFATYNLFAMSEAGLLLKVAALTVPINIGIDLLLVSWLGASGIAIGSTLTSTLHACLLVYALERRLHGTPRIWPHSSMRLAIACSLMMIVSVFAIRLGPTVQQSAPLLIHFLWLSGVASVGVGAYLIGAVSVRLEEAQILQGWCVARWRSVW